VSLRARLCLTLEHGERGSQDYGTKTRGWSHWVVENCFVAVVFLGKNWEKSQLVRRSVANLAPIGERKCRL